MQLGVVKSSDVHFCGAGGIAEDVCLSQRTIDSDSLHGWWDSYNQVLFCDVQGDCRVSCGIDDSCYIDY